MGVEVEVTGNVDECCLSYNDLSPGELIKYGGDYYVVVPKGTADSDGDEFIATGITCDDFLYEDDDDRCTRMDGTLKVPQ